MATKLLTVCNKTLGSNFFVKILGPLVQRILHDARLRDEDKTKPDDCSDVPADVILGVCEEIFDNIEMSLAEIPAYECSCQCHDHSRRLKATTDHMPRSDL